MYKKDYCISKQAFLENRQKISPTAFIELNDAINKDIYEECNESNLWNEYRLSAVDGNMVELPRNKLIAETLQQLKYVQRAGQGVDIIYRDILALGKQMPVYTVYSDAVGLTLLSTFEDKLLYANTEETITPNCIS